MSSLDNWQLMHGDDPIGVLEVYETDQPWYECNFYPSNNFKKHQAFFIEFQERYSNGSIKNYNEFFAELKTHDYCVILKDKKMIEFIIVFDETNKKARLRSRAIVST